MTWFAETLHPHSRATYEVSKILHQVKTDFQELVIFENPRFGRMLALDGAIQTTEADEFVYHEMMAHLPILTHGQAKRVLIIGGGDGGVLREVLKHPGIEEAVLVEIDAGVVEMSRRFLPAICQDAFDNPRARVVIADGIAFVRDTAERFDVIVVDSTDPVGPGEVLFTPAFYTDCKRCLTEGGVLVNQNGVPFMQPQEVTTTYRRLRPIFADVSFFLGVIPTYVGGFMTMGFASTAEGLRDQSVAEIAGRFQASGIKGLKYYSPEVHVAAFALPPFIRDLMTEA